MFKYIGDLVSAQRIDTRNGDTSAISDDTFVRYNQYAQNMLFGLITKSFPRCFITKYTTPIVANQDEYVVADHLAFGTRIIMVQYSYDGTEANFKRLLPNNNPYTLARKQPGRPYFYERQHGKVVLLPVPTLAEGSIRIWYERALDILSLRVARVNGTPSGAVIDLTHSGFGAPSSTVETSLQVAGDVICLSKPDGTPVLYNGVISSYNTGTDALTLADDVADYLVDGYALADLADTYLTLGQYTSTHSTLPNEAEEYFIEYVNRCVHNVDSSKQWAATDKQLTQIAAMILASYASADKDVKSFPVHDFDMLIPGYR